MRQTRVYLYLLLATLFWAGNFVFSKFIVEEFTPLQMTFLRWSVAALPLVALALVFEKPKLRTIVKDLPLLVMMSIAGVVLYNFLLYTSVQHISSLDAALIGAINPALIAIAAALLLGERVRLRGVLGLVISLVGVVLVLTRGTLDSGFGGAFGVGDLLMVGAILSWTGYAILGRKITTPPITATAVNAVIGVVILAPFTFATGGVSFDVSTGALWGMLYVAIFPSIMSFMLWNIAVSKIGPSRSGPFINLIVVFTALIGAFFGIMVTPVQVGGGLLVFVGVYLTSSRSKAHQELRV